MDPLAADDPNSNVIPMPPYDPWGLPRGRRGIPIAVSDGVVAIIRSEGGDLKLSGGDLHIREANGPWRVVTRADRQRLRCLTQEGVEALGEGARLSVVTASWRRLLEHPGLYVPVAHCRNDDDELIPVSQEPQVCPVAQWAEAVLVPVELGRVSRRDLLVGFRGWWREHTDDNVRLLSCAWFLRRLRIACPHITDAKIEGVLYLGGVQLTDLGLGYWSQEAVNASRYGGITTTAASAAAVNRMARESHQKIVPGKVIQGQRI